MEITGQEYGKAMARYRREGPWELDDITDYFEENREYTACEVCGTRIRYVHSVSNAKLGEELDVGCCCAERLCRSKAPRIAEEEFKSRQRKKATVLRQRKAFDDGFPEKWIQTMNGNFRETVRGMNVVIFKVRYGADKGKFCMVIDGEFGEKYSDPDEAFEEAAKILYPMPDEEQA